MRSNSLSDDWPLLNTPDVNKQNHQRVKSPTKVNTDHYNGDLKTCDFLLRCVQ